MTFEEFEDVFNDFTLMPCDNMKRLQMIIIEGEQVISYIIYNSLYYTSCISVVTHLHITFSAVFIILVGFHPTFPCTIAFTEAKFDFFFSLNKDRHHLANVNPLR